MANLNKKRSDSLLQSDVFFNELFFGLFGYGFWCLGRFGLAVVRFTFTITGILFIMISQLMLVNSPIQDKIFNNMTILTIAGGVILSLSLIWNIVTLVMVFTADIRDGNGVKIQHWGTDVEANPSLEEEFEYRQAEILLKNQPDQSEGIVLIDQNTETTDVSSNVFETSVIETSDLNEPEAVNIYSPPEAVVTEDVHGQATQQASHASIYQESIYTSDLNEEELVENPLYFSETISSVVPAVEQSIEEFDKMSSEDFSSNSPIVNIEENVEIARQIEMINAQQVQTSQLHIAQQVEIPFEKLQHIHHTTFTLEEIESGIVDEHIEIRGQHNFGLHS